MRCTRRRVLASLTSLSLAGTLAVASAAPRADTQEILDAARTAVADMSADRDFAGLRADLANAKAVLVFPRIFAGGLVLGGSGGNGVLMVRDAGSGRWDGPVFYTLGGISAGLEAGTFNGSLVLVVQSEKALDSIYRTSTRLGGNATIALGSKAATAARAASSDFVAYSKVNGVFAGVAVDGVVLDVRKSLNDAFYGRSLTPSEMVLAPTSESRPADGLRQALHDAAP